MTIIIKPIITEKSMTYARSGLYTFGVLPSATKSQIKEAVQMAFAVKVISINTSLRHLPGKSTGSKRLTGPDGRSKHATVRLAKGQSIDLFDLKEEK